jgi:hypothetical protein
MKKLFIALLALGLIAPAVLHAQVKPFVGASIGASFYDTSIEDVSGDDFKLEGEEFAWKIFGGLTAMKFLGLEGGYVYLGETQNSNDSFTAESKTTGWDLFAVGNLPVGPIGVFGKAGILWWRSDGNFNEDPFEVTGSDFMWGLGAMLKLGGLGIRAEFERVEMEDGASVMLLTGGVTFGM